MRYKGATKGLIVFVNDDTQETAVFALEPLHVSGEIYDLLTKGGIGIFQGEIKVDEVTYGELKNVLSTHTDNIGTGDDSTTTFNGTLSNTPVRPGTVKVTAGDVEGADDGSGNIVGDGVSGTIDYNTGAISLTFDTAPASGVSIDASYAAVSFDPFA